MDLRLERKIEGRAAQDVEYCRWFVFSGLNNNITFPAHFTSIIDHLHITIKVPAHGVVDVVPYTPSNYIYIYIHLH